MHPLLCRWQAVSPFDDAAIPAFLQFPVTFYDEKPANVIFAADRISTTEEPLFKCRLQPTSRSFSIRFVSEAELLLLLLMHNIVTGSVIWLSVRLHYSINGIVICSRCTRRGSLSVKQLALTRFFFEKKKEKTL